MFAHPIRRLPVFMAALLAVGSVTLLLAPNSGSKAPRASAGTAGSARTAAATVGGFSYGQLQSATVGASGCATNQGGEPALHVARDNNVYLGAERGIGSGSDLWRGLSSTGGASANACKLEYRGQPNAVAGTGASGGDIDVAVASAPNALGKYNLYVASLNLGSVSVAHSSDNATTFSNTPVQAGLPLDDREWVAAYGANTSLLTYHDVATGNIDVLRSDDAGTTYHQISTAIAPTDYRAANNNELGNIVIDHRNPSPRGFYAYQSFVAPSDPSGQAYNEAFVAVSNDGGSTWADRPVPCSTKSGGSLDHNFPNVSVAPDGTLWYAWSNDRDVYTASSHDHGVTWTCSGRVSTTTSQAIYPWLVATSAGVDLVYYGSPTPPGTPTTQTFYVYFAQNLTSAPTAWGGPARLMAVHRGSVCEGGISCSGGRQLFDDFGVDTDSLGYAHIAYSHDAPDLGGGGSYAGSAVQVSGTPVGAPNN